MSNNKISIAIPYHGRVDYFKNTLDSLVAQSSKEFEIVIGDDSSSRKDIEDLRKLVEIYREKGLDITVVRTSANLGAIANTKQAVLSCKNDIIRILHTDDIISSNTIKLELEIFNKYPETFFIFHNASLFRQKFIANEHNKWSKDSWVENWLVTKNYTHSILPSCLVFTKDVLNEVGFFNPEFEFMYDWEYQIRLFEYAYRNNKIVIEVEEGYVGWRYSKFSESYNRSLDCWRDSRKIAKLLDEHAKRLSNLIPYRAKKIKKFKKIFNKRLVYEYNSLDTKFKLPLKFCISRFFRNMFCLILKLKKDERYTNIRFLFFRFKILRNSIKKRKKVGKFLQKAPVPLFVDDNYVYYTKYPMYSQNISKKCSYFFAPKIGILLQGPIIEKNNFTYETIKIYKNMFQNQNVEIILSTWTDSKDYQLEKFKALNINIVQSDKIIFSGRGNCNYQIISTKAGIQEAQRLSCEYVLKSRADQRFYKTDILEFFINLLKTFPPKGASKLKERIIACSFNSFLYRLYGISDMFLFGSILDMEKYFDIPFDNHSRIEWEGKTDLELFQMYSPESYIARYFLKNIGHDIKESLEDSFKVYSDYFIFVDKEMLMMYWPKYSNENSRWSFFYPNPMDEVKFVDWLNFYSNENNYKYYLEQKWNGLPKF